MMNLRSMLTTLTLLAGASVLTACDAVQESFGRNRGTATEVVSTSTLPVFDPSNPVTAFPANTLDPSGDVARYSLGSVYSVGGQTVTPQEDLTYQRDGIAVMGSELFSGTTASDERYNPGLYTAAHRTLPFSTIIKVTNRDNERATLMRVNDRGPDDFTNILEVTPAGAKALGFGNSNVANVTVEVVETVTRNVAQVTGGKLLRPSHSTIHSPFSPPHQLSRAQARRCRVRPMRSTTTPGPSSTFRPVPTASAPMRSRCSNCWQRPATW